MKPLYNIEICARCSNSIGEGVGRNNTPNHGILCMDCGEAIGLRDQKQKASRPGTSIRIPVAAPVDDELLDP